MQLLAIFDLNEREELTADLCDVETKELVMYVEYSPDEQGSFEDQLKAVAAQHGSEIVEWDRSIAARLPEPHPGL